MVYLSRLGSGTGGVIDARVEVAPAGFDATGAGEGFVGAVDAGGADARGPNTRRISGR
jgi:hypothetical protein